MSSEATKRWKAKNKDKQAGYAKKHRLEKGVLINPNPKALQRSRNRKFVDDYLLVHPCVDCKEADPILLEFDHINDDKEFNISVAIFKGWSTKRLLAEMEKCEVRCCNCHRKKTFERRIIVEKRYSIRIRFNRQCVNEYLLSNPCVDCAEPNIVILEFDHVRGEKLIAISKSIYLGWELEDIFKEIAKCEVRCCNCHRKQTYSRSKNK